MVRLVQGGVAVYHGLIDLYKVRHKARGLLISLHSKLGLAVCMVGEPKLVERVGIHGADQERGL